MADSPHDGCLLTPAPQTESVSNGPDGRSDEELLGRYRRTLAPEDLAEISRRHGPMVLRTAMRLVGNVHDAQDVAQSTFLALAQRPAAVRRSLTGYLHEQVRASASELFRSRRRRERREREAIDRGDPGGHRTPGADSGAELREELDAALARLPDPLKQAVILRYLEGHSQQEAARRAGCTPVTMGWRSMKGLEKLRAILGRRGLGVTGGTLAALIAAEAKAGTAAAGVTAAATGKAAGLTAHVLVRKLILASAARQVATGLAILVPLAVGAGLKLRRPPAPTAAAPARPTGIPASPAFTPTLGVFDRTLDIGRPAQAGSVQYADGRYKVQAGGAHIYLDEDHFRYICRPWDGDGEFVARVDVDPTQPNVQVAAGVMVRERLEPNSLHAAIVVTRVESRATWRGPKTVPLSQVAIDDLPARGVQWVRLVRRGDHIAMSVRPDSATEWTLVRELDLPMSRSLYAGLAVTSNNDLMIGTATFDQVVFAP